MAEKKPLTDKEPNNEVKEVKEILFRIDERVISLIETQSYFRDKIEKMLEHNTILNQRITHLEAVFNGEKFQEVVKEYHEIKHKIQSFVEVECMIELLDKRIQSLEKVLADGKKQSDIFFGWFSWFFNEILFKLLLVVLTAWLLWKFGLK